MAYWMSAMPFHAREVDSIAQAAKGRTDDARGPRHRPAFGVQTAGKARVRRGPIQIVLHVVFARPGELHRAADGLRNLDRFADEIVAAATSEATAQDRGCGS